MWPWVQTKQRCRAPARVNTTRIFSICCARRMCGAERCGMRHRHTNQRPCLDQRWHPRQHGSHQGLRSAARPHDTRQLMRLEQHCIHNGFCNLYFCHVVWFRSDSLPLFTFFSPLCRFIFLSIYFSSLLFSFFSPLSFYFPLYLFLLSSLLFFSLLSVILFSSLLHLIVEYSFVSYPTLTQHDSLLK